MRIARSLLTVAMSASLAACGVDGSLEASAGGELASFHDAARRGLLADDSLLAATITGLGEADGLWPWFASDGVYLHPGVELLSGPAAVRDFLRQTFPDRHAQTQRLHRETGDVSSDAQLGYTFGWFEEDVRAADGTTTTGFGKYLATWRRAGALWRIAGFVRNPGSRAPSPPPADAAILAGDHGVAQHGSPIDPTGEILPPSGGPAGGAVGVPTPRAPASPIGPRDQALAADTAFAALSVARGYTIAFTGYGAADAVIAGGSDFFWNVAGIARAWGGWKPAETLDWSPTLGRAASSGDLAFTVGHAVFSVAHDATVDRSYSKYLTVWIHQADDTWRFLLDAGNGRPVPATP